MAPAERNLWGVCGWFGEIPTAAPPAHLLSQMATDFSGPVEGARAFVEREAAVFLSPTTPGAALAIEGRVVAAVFGEPSWSDTDLAAKARETDHARAALFAWRRWGRDGLLMRLHGPFGLIILDSAASEALIAIDRLGIQPLTFARLKGGAVVFATTATAVARHPAVGAELSQQGLFNYLFFYRVPAPDTIFVGINKLLPAQRLSINKGQSDTAFYWQIPFAASRRESVRDLDNALFACLRAAVRNSTDGQEWSRLGTFLSGGLDSSTITGVVNELAPSPIKAFTIGFDSPGYDERHYAAVAARHFGVDHHTYEVTAADVLDAVPAIAAAYDEPFGNASAVPVYYCAKFAKSQGVETLIAGDGGDELFAGNAAHLRMKIFELYSRIPALLRRQVIEPLVSAMPPAQWNIMGRKARRYIEHANVPMPDRMFSDARALLERAAAIMGADRLVNVDLEAPLRLLREVYSRPVDARFEQRVHQLELQVILADNDLRKVNRMCALAGIQVRFPMLDEAVCEFSAGIPPELLLRHLKLRAFFKRAMIGYLPKETLDKDKHGFGLPVGPWLNPGTKLQAFAYDCLASLKRRNLLQPAYIDELMGRHRSDPHPINADPIWDAMMLELWLDTHAHLPSRSAGP